MCGRYVVTSAPEAIRALFGYPERPDFPPRYNIAPSQPIAIVRMQDGRRQFALVRWGLLPSWVKDPRSFTLLGNARGESLGEKPAFRAALKYRRCLIPADGFYEWKANGARKQPYFVRSTTGKPFAFAGLWETWTGPNGEELETTTIVTTRANQSLAEIHERMPVIIPPDAYDLWLDCVNVDVETATALIEPAPNSLLEAYAVSSAVNRTANDSPKLLERWPGSAEVEPAGQRPLKSRARAAAGGNSDDGQGALF